MHFYAHHGCFDEERKIGTHFSVDVAIDVSETRNSVTSDCLKDALNYQAVYNLIAQEMKQTSHLLEHVAGRIVKALKANFPQTGRIKVSISKINPPLGGQGGASRIVLTTE